MWFFKNDKNKDWASNLRYITSFDTVEDFWALYNHILPASKLGVGCDYSLFKGLTIGKKIVGEMCNEKYTVKRGVVIGH